MIILLQVREDSYLSKKYVKIFDYFLLIKTKVIKPYKENT